MSIAPVHERFDALMRRVYPAEIIAALTEDDIDEMRRLYFAGFHDMYEIVETGCDLNPEEGEALAKAIKLELHKFFAALQKP